MSTASQHDTVACFTLAAMNAREIRKHITADDIYEWTAYGKGSCWDWLGSLHNDGYAAWNVGGRQIKVHRASYLLFVGPIPKKRFVVHTCHDRACVNPDCLKLVTHKGLYQHNLERGDVARGERNGFSKLTAKNVRRIRRLAESGKYTHRQIGDIYGCHQCNITRIVNRNYWAHIE